MNGGGDTPAVPQSTQKQLAIECGDLPSSDAVMPPGTRWQSAMPGMALDCMAAACPLTAKGASPGSTISSASSKLAIKFTLPRTMRMVSTRIMTR